MKRRTRDAYWADIGAPKSKKKLDSDEATAVSNARLDQIARWALALKVDFARDDDADLFLKAAWPHWPPEKRNAKRVEAFAIRCGAKRVSKEILAECHGWNCRRPTAIQLGKMLRVTHEARERWKLWQFIACDKTEAERDELKREKKRAANKNYAAKTRRKKGMKVRAEYIAGCLTATKPWDAEKISRRTWERRRRKSKASRVASVWTNSKDIHHPRTCDSRNGGRSVPSMKGRKGDTSRKEAGRALVIF